MANKAVVLYQSVKAKNGWILQEVVDDLPKFSKGPLYVTWYEGSKKRSEPVRRDSEFALRMLKKKRLELAYKGAGGEIKESDEGADPSSNSNYTRKKVSVGVREYLAALAPPQIDLTIRPHPLVRATASRLRSLSRKDEVGILLPREPGGLDIKVSAETLDRALHVMAQIIAVLECQGHSVEVSDQDHTLAGINGERVRFGIEEPIRKVVTQ